MGVRRSGSGSIVIDRNLEPQHRQLLQELRLGQRQLYRDGAIVSGGGSGEELLRTAERRLPRQLAFFVRRSGARRLLRTCRGI